MFPSYVKTDFWIILALPCPNYRFIWRGGGWYLLTSLQIRSMPPPLMDTPFRGNGGRILQAQGAVIPSAVKVVKGICLYLRFNWGGVLQQNPHRYRDTCIVAFQNISLFILAQIKWFFNPLVDSMHGWNTAFSFVVCKY